MCCHAVLDPVLGKSTVKRGKAVIMKIGDAEVEVDPKFRLYLQTKLSNPHYKPEIAAQTTLMNFCVTEKGLEDQLLAQVVDHERPDLQVGSLPDGALLGGSISTLFGVHQQHTAFTAKSSHGACSEQMVGHFMANSCTP
jgi:hypothetical protein